MTVSRIAHDGGSPEGANSTYVLPDRGVVIDPGPPGERARETLRGGISGTREIETIDHVLLTHWHIDHAGLAIRLARAADASVHLHEADAPLVGNYARERRRRLARDERKLKEWGVPAERIATVINGDEPSPLPPSSPVEAHAHGDTIAGVELIHTPGHTLGHATFRAGSALFVGDAVLGTYTPNVGGSDTRVENALTMYRDTLERLREYGESAYPGHGAALDHVARIEAIGNHHDRRSASVLAVLDERETVTPWEVATTLFGEMRGVHAKMGAGEAAAHLESLASSGDVVRTGSGPERFGR
jgi:glyoxylase-like metal-dependent hydrolase (beta-lactamase superfamily II)